MTKHSAARTQTSSNQSLVRVKASAIACQSLVEAVFPNRSDPEADFSSVIEVEGVVVASLDSNRSLCWIVEVESNAGGACSKIDPLKATDGYGAAAAGETLRLADRGVLMFLTLNTKVSAAVAEPSETRTVIVAVPV